MTHSCTGNSTEKEIPSRVPLPSSPSPTADAKLSSHMKILT